MTTIKELWRRELLRRALSLPNVSAEEALAGAALALREMPTPPVGEWFLRELPEGIGEALQVLDGAVKDLQPCVEVALSLLPAPPDTLEIP